MRQYGYRDECVAEAAMHIKQHRDFSATVLKVRDALRDGKHISREDLLAFLNDWLLDHILTTDRRLGDFILAKQSR